LPRHDTLIFGGLQGKKRASAEAFDAWYAGQMYTALMIGAVFVIVLGVPTVVWLTKLIRPPKPEEEAIHRGVENARRRIDRFPY
jgi:hypothetical protein